MPIITVSPAESAGFSESRHSSARNQKDTFSAQSGQTDVDRRPRLMLGTKSEQFGLDSRDCLAPRCRQTSPDVSATAAARLTRRAAVVGSRSVDSRTQI